jgi:hypothetical protein
MRLLRNLTPMVAAVGLLCLAPLAGAQTAPQPVGELLPPSERVDGITAGEAMGEMWYRGYTLPADQNQLFGHGQPCVRLGRTGRVLVGIAFQAGPCTIDRDTTVLIWGITAPCDSFASDPTMYGADEAAQRRCAVRAVTSAVGSVALTVDGRGPVELARSRFAIFSPQRHVVVRPDNYFHYAPGRGTFTAWGYMAWLRALPPGQHNIRTETRSLDDSLLEVISLDVNVRG